MRKHKILLIVTFVLSLILFVSCNNVPTGEKTLTEPSVGETEDKKTEGTKETENQKTEETKENSVKIRSIDANIAIKKNRKNAGTEELDFNYIVINKSQTDITFTITLDNPEAYGIDALRVTCDDPEAKIQVDGEFKPIAQEADKTRVINWSSEDPYTKTYNIKTTSEEAIATFKVVDIRLAGHEKFQSKETENTDLGNNELKIYKMDDDAIELSVIENTFDYIKFDFIVKTEYEGVISNVKVDGVDRDDEIGGWRLEESKSV